MQDFTKELYNLNNPMDKKNFKEFYALLKTSFPKSERRTKRDFRSLVFGGEFYNVLALKREGKIVAFFTFWQFEDFSFGDYFAVLPELRCQNIGTEILKEIVKIAKMPHVFEVEIPDTEISQRRVNFYKRNGFCLNDFEYMLPPLRKSSKPLPMRIMSYPFRLSQDEFDKIKKTVYSVVYKA